jgi:hypothetical protein
VPDQSLLALCRPAVFSFLLGQKSLGLTDIAKATITEDTVRLNYVHGIWYQVRGRTATVAAAVAPPAGLTAACRSSACV